MQEIIFDGKKNKIKIGDNVIFSPIVDFDIEEKYFFKRKNIDGVIVRFFKRRDKHFCFIKNDNGKLSVSPCDGVLKSIKTRLHVGKSYRDTMNIRCPYSYNKKGYFYGVTFLFQEYKDGIYHYYLDKKSTDIKYFSALECFFKKNQTNKYCSYEIHKSENNIEYKEI